MAGEVSSDDTDSVCSHEGGLAGSRCSTTDSGLDEFSVPRVLEVHTDEASQEQVRKGMQRNIETSLRSERTL